MSRESIHVRRRPITACWNCELPFGRGRAFGANVNGFVDRLIGGWEWHGAARVQSGRPMSFGNVQLVGMNVGELQDMIRWESNPT